VFINANNARMPTKLTVEQIHEMAGHLCIGFCKVLGLDYSKVSESQKLLIFILAKEVIVHSGESSTTYPDFQPTSLGPVPQTSELIIKEDCFSGEKLFCPESLGEGDNYFHFASLIQLFFLISKQAFLKKVCQITPLVTDVVLRSIAASRLLGGESDSSGLDESLSSFRNRLNCARLVPQDFVDAVNGLFASQSDLNTMPQRDEVVDACFAVLGESQESNAIVWLVDSFFSGMHLPGPVESPASWYERILRIYCSRLGKGAPSSSADRRDDKKYGRQLTEFKGNPLKKLVIDEALLRLRRFADNEITVINKQEFEGKLFDKFYGLKDADCDDPTFERLMRVSISLAYCALGLRKKLGGWFADESGVEWLDLAAAH
jgi:hypothetical protein